MPTVETPATDLPLERWAFAIRDAAIAAGAAILEIYNTDFEVRTKNDESPVTDADEAAEVVIEARLNALSPKFPVVAEEGMSRGAGPTDVGARFWLVDPLDGTKEFVKRSGEFTVNIALIDDGKPIIGVVYAPAKGRLFLALSPERAEVYEVDDQGRCGPGRILAARIAPSDGLVVATSRSHGLKDTEEFLATVKVAKIIPAGSSLKFCLIAAAEADLYPRNGRTMEWDTAAGHAVLGAAGGRVTTFTGAPFTYGKPGFENPAFIASGKPAPGDQQSNP